MISALFIFALWAPFAQAEETRLPSVQVLGTSPKSIPEKGEFSGESLKIDPNATSSVSDVIESQSSFVPLSSGSERTSGSFLVRGLDPIQNRTFIEGISLSGVEYPQTYVGLLPSELIRRVDVYAEGIPIFLSEDGLGSAINLRLSDLGQKRATLLAKGGSLSYLKLLGRVGAGGSFRSEMAIEYSSATEDFAFYDDNGTPFNSDDDKISVRQNNRYQRLLLFPRLGLVHTENTRVELFGLGSWYESALPGSVRSPTSGNLTQFQSLAAIKLEQKLSSAWSLDSALSFKYGQDQVSGVRVAGFIPGNTEGLGGKLQFGTRYDGKWIWENVASTALDRFSDSTRSYKERAQVTLGSSASIPILDPRLTFRPALAGYYLSYSPGSVSAEQASVFGTASSRSYVAISPRAGLGFQWTKSLQLRTSVGQFVRSPSLLEIYGTPSGLTPNSQLRDEKALKADLGADWSHAVSDGVFSQVRISSTFFISRAHDLISYVQNSPQTWAAVNVGESSIVGQEAQAEVKTRWGVSAKVSGTLLWTENLSEETFLRGRELPGRSPYRIVSSLGYEQGNWNAGYQVVFSGATYWDLANLKQVGSRMDHSLYVNWDTKSFGSLRLEGKNLTDDITATSLIGGWPVIDNTTAVSGYPSPGRRVSLSWRIDV